MDDFLTIVAGICELIFAVSIIYVRIGDPEATREFCKRHRVIQIAWPAATVIGFIGFIVFFIQMIQK